MSGKLTLKWGTVKGWEGLEGDALTAMQRFSDLGMSLSAMDQEMTPEHVEALCDAIDDVDEPIIHDWDGKEMTREQAKAYVRDYAEKRNA